MRCHPSSSLMPLPLTTAGLASQGALPAHLAVRMWPLPRTSTALPLSPPVPGCLCATGVLAECVKQAVWDEKTNSQLVQIRSDSAGSDRITLWSWGSWDSKSSVVQVAALRVVPKAGAQRHPPTQPRKCGMRTGGLPLADCTLPIPCCRPQLVWRGTVPSPTTPCWQVCRDQQCGACCLQCSAPLAHALLNLFAAACPVAQRF